MPKFNRNSEKNGLEISFEGKPSNDIRTELKSMGFRWHRANKFWYAKETPERLELVERLCVGGTVQGQSPTRFSSSQATAITGSKAVKPTMNKRCCYFNTIQGFLSEQEEVGYGRHTVALQFL